MQVGVGVLDLQLVRLHHHLHLALFSISLPTTTLLQEWARKEQNTHFDHVAVLRDPEPCEAQRAIAKKSSLLSQHETPPQLLNATGRSWSCGLRDGAKDEGK